MQFPITYQLLIPLLLVLVYAITFLCNISMYLSGPIVINILAFSLITTISACIHAKFLTRIKNILAIYILIIAILASIENIHVQMQNMQEQQINYIIEHYSTGDTITI